MSRFVFVLGAGASAAAGGPVASNFMDKAKQLQRNGDLVGKDKDAFDLVFRAREALKAVHSKASLDLANLEVLFNAFEMAALFNRLGPLTEQEVQGLPEAMRRLIARTIEANLVFPMQARTNALPAVLPPTPYEPFADLLSKMTDRKWDDLCVITFNYDLAIDYTFNYVGIPYSYGLDGRQPGQVDLLKLHGSLNWRRCPECKAIVPWHLRDYLQRFQWPHVPGSKQARLETSLHFPESGHCGPPLNTEPSIVPPTWSKAAHHSQLESVWRLAARHLSQAEYIFIIGYSYPPTDEFFKYLYALGSIGEGWLERVFVFNPDSAVGSRIKALMGPLAVDKFTSLTNPFDQAIAYLDKLRPL